MVVHLHDCFHIQKTPAIEHRCTMFFAKKTVFLCKKLRCENHENRSHLPLSFNLVLCGSSLAAGVCKRLARAEAEEPSSLKKSDPSTSVGTNTSFAEAGYHLPRRQAQDTLKRTSAAEGLKGYHVQNAMYPWPCSPFYCRTKTRLSLPNLSQQVQELSKLYTQSWETSGQQLRSSKSRAWVSCLHTLTFATNQDLPWLTIREDEVGRSQVSKLVKEEKIGFMTLGT